MVDGERSAERKFGNSGIYVRIFTFLVPNREDSSLIQRCVNCVRDSEEIRILWSRAGGKLLRDWMSGRWRRHYTCIELSCAANYSSDTASCSYVDLLIDIEGTT